MAKASTRYCGNSGLNVKELTLGFDSKNTKPLFSARTKKGVRSMTLKNNYTIQEAKTADEVSALRDVWQTMRPELNADIDFYLTINQSRAEIIRPHVIILSRKGTPCSFLMGRYEIKPFEVALGYRKLRLPPVRWLTFVHGGLLGESSEDNVSLLTESVSKSLKNGEADVAWFHNLDVDSRIFHTVTKAAGMLSRDYFPVLVDHWKAQVPNSFDELLRQRSQNTRHYLKRYAKRMQEAFGDQITIRKLRELSDVESILADCETVASKGYQRGLQVGFINNDETRRLMALAANRGWLRSYILYISGLPVAFWNGYLYRRTLCTWTTAYDPQYSEFRPGSFLLRRMVEDLCQEKAVDELDFGVGEADYKRQWCDQNHRESSVFLFAPTLRGIVLNAFRTPLIAGSLAARSLLRKTGMMKKIKRLWRDRLTPKG